MQLDRLSVMGIQRWQSRDRVPSESTSDSDSPNQCFSAYAAISCRESNSGEMLRWLWVVPKVSLTAKQLQLLDKILSATGSSWESVSVADNYIDSNQLDSLLNSPLSAIVVMAKSVQWTALLSHPLYLRKQYFIGLELDELLQEPEKKKQIWSSLQQLMVDD